MDQNEREAVNRALRAGAKRTGAALVERAPGRSCGTCMLCCKVYTIAELNKRAGNWCVHAELGRGCKIYEDRPDTCKAFYCMWLIDPTLGPEWKPEKSHFVVALDLITHDALTISPAPDRPDAWKKEPYYSTIKGWARKFCPENRKVLVKDRHGSVTAVLPDREVELGVVGADHEVVISSDGAAYSATTRPKMKFAKPAAEYG